MPLQNINAEKIQGNLAITSISATTYYNLPTSGGSFTGGTVSGATIFTGGLSANTISATTIYGNDLTVTGGTQSLFSGSSSVELVKIIQNGSGDAFVVQDVSNGDASHFVINASGNTAIGLTQPLGNDKLTVSGNTSVYGSFNATTISATTYQNLPQDVFVTGGTLSTGGTITLNRNDGNNVNITNINSGNAVVDNFYFQISNSTDTRPVFEDTDVVFGWDETGNQLEFTMKVAPLGSGDMRSLAYIVGGVTQNTAITTINVIYDVYAAGVSAGNRLETFITAENDATYPAYYVVVYNTGESYLNTVWIQRITRK